MNIFSWLNKAFENDEPKTTKEQTTTAVVDAPKEVKALNPHESLLTAAILFLTTVEQESESYTLQCRNAYNELKRLEKLGLSNTSTAHKYKHDADKYSLHLAAKKLIVRMCETWRKIGNDTLILKMEHFVDVLNRYNLVCGWIEDYVGVIPATAIDSFEKAHKIAKKGPWKFDSSIAGGYIGITGLTWISQRQEDHDNKYNPFYIAAPRECFRTVPVYRTLDPFIFSVPFHWSDEPQIVLIHAKWGAEAEDATIKRYEQLRDAIIGISKSLTV